MFESVHPDRGEDGLVRAARIFEVLSVLGLLLTAFGVVMRWRGDFYFSDRWLWQNVIFAILAFLTAGGIERQRKWAKWLAYAQGVIALFNVPIGTAVGIAVLIYVRRASRAGLFQ